MKNIYKLLMLPILILFSNYSYSQCRSIGQDSIIREVQSNRFETVVENYNSNPQLLSASIESYLLGTSDIEIENFSLFFIDLGPIPGFDNKIKVRVTLKFDVFECRQEMPPMETTPPNCLDAGNILFRDTFISDSLHLALDDYLKNDSMLLYLVLDIEDPLAPNQFRDNIDITIQLIDGPFPGKQWARADITYDLIDCGFQSIPMDSCDILSEFGEWISCNPKDTITVIDNMPITEICSIISTYGTCEIECKSLVISIPDPQDCRSSCYSSVCYVKDSTGNLKEFDCEDISYTAISCSDKFGRIPKYVISRGNKVPPPNDYLPDWVVDLKKSLAAD